MVMTEQNTTQTTKQNEARSLASKQSKNKNGSLNHQKRNRSDFQTNKNPKSHKPFDSNKKKVVFNPDEFFWLYGESDIREDYELLGVSSETFSKSSTVIETAKGLLKEKIRSIGGNSVIGLKVERGDSSRNAFGTGYTAANFTASGCASLVVPKKLDNFRKNDLKENFRKKLDADTNRIEIQEKVPVSFFRTLSIFVVSILLILAVAFLLI